MEKPDISVDTYGYEAANLKYYFNLYATNYNSSEDKINKQSHLITIKKYLDQKIEEFITQREEELNNIGNFFLQPFIDNKEIKKGFDQYLDGTAFPKLIGKHSGLSAKDVFRLENLATTVKNLKLSKKGQFIFFKHSHEYFKAEISQLREDNLRNIYLNVDWDFKKIESAIISAIKFNRRTMVHNVQRLGVNRVLLYLFREEKIGSNIPLWDMLDEEVQRELLDDDKTKYGFHQINSEWIQKTFQTLKNGDIPKDEELNKSKILDDLENIPGHGLSDNRVAKQTKLLYEYKFGYSISVSDIKRKNGLI